MQTPRRITRVLHSAVLAQQHLPDVLYDVVLLGNGCELCSFGVGRGPVEKGKPSPTRFDDWLMAYEAHLTNHLEDLHLSNDFENFNDVLFGKFHTLMSFFQVRGVSRQSQLPT